MHSFLGTTYFALIICSAFVASYAECPPGFVEYNTMCMQQSEKCPTNYALVNGLCYAATSASNTQVGAPCQSSPSSTTPCPSAPINNVPCGNTAVTPGPTTPCATTSCPNTPCSSTTCLTNTCSSSTPGPIAPCSTTSCPTSTCPNNTCPNTPSPTVPCPAAPCPTTTSPTTTCPNTVNPTAPCPSSTCPTSTCPNNTCTTTPCSTTPCHNTPCPPPFTATTTTSTTTTTTIRPTVTTSRTTTESPPAQVYKCPDGTVLIRNQCRLIYCGSGRVYRDNKCIQIVCPEGTVWKGNRCAPLEPIVHSVVFNNTIITYFNRTEPDVIVNNINNVVVNSTNAATIDIASQTEVKEPCDEEKETKIVDNDGGNKTHTQCCTVISPRICQPGQSNKWNCYNRRYRRCGEICVAPVITLRPPQVAQCGTGVVMPPDTDYRQCRQTGHCPESDDFYDCSGCAMNNMSSCSSYCYNYNCLERKCHYYDQQHFCSLYPGENGCLERDGCMDGWCNGGNY